jgi:hypothetical protein
MSMSKRNDISLTRGEVWSTIAERALAICRAHPTWSTRQCAEELMQGPFRFYLNYRQAVDEIELARKCIAADTRPGDSEPDPNHGNGGTDAA